MPRCMFKADLRAFIVFIAVCCLFTAGCACEGVGSDGAGSDDDASDDDGADDDSGDDDGGAPSFPEFHKSSWDCYICHVDGLYRTPLEPHGHTYGAPDECLGCHTSDDGTFTDPDAPEGHGSDQDCRNCHQGEHDRSWGDPDQCLACHLPGTGGGAPSSPDSHDNAWNCYLCHATDFLGAQGEPHDGDYAAPTDCDDCHAVGTWEYTNPNAPADHGSTVGCFDCHATEHDKNWTDQDQCFVCHAPGEGGPEFSKDHKTTWNCYICHETNFNGSPREPHGGDYDAPDQCLACHAMGTFSSSRHGPEPEDDHTPSWNCLDCHSARHGKPWQDNDQCKLCHRF